MSTQSKEHATLSTHVTRHRYTSDCEQALLVLVAPSLAAAQHAAAAPAIMISILQPAAGAAPAAALAADARFGSCQRKLILEYKL